MDKYQYWFNAFVKKPYALIAVIFMIISFELAYKLVDVYKTQKLEMIECEKDKVILQGLIDKQNKVILDLSVSESKLKAIVEINSQLNSKIKYRK